MFGTKFWSIESGVILSVEQKTWRMAATTTLRLRPMPRRLRSPPVPQEPKMYLHWSGKMNISMSLSLMTTDM